MYKWYERDSSPRWLQAALRRMPDAALAALARVATLLITLLTRGRSRYVTLLVWYVHGLRRVNDKLARGEVSEFVGTLLANGHWEAGRSAEEDLFAYANGRARERPSRATGRMVGYLVALELTLALVRAHRWRDGRSAGTSIVYVPNYDLLLGAALGETKRRRRPTPPPRVRHRRRLRARAATDWLVSHLASFLPPPMREPIVGDLMEDLSTYRALGRPEWRLWLHVIWQLRGAWRRAHGRAGGE